MYDFIEMAVWTFAGAGVTWLLIPLIIRWHRTHVHGQVTRELHHTHSQPMPRLGGLALAGTFALAALVAFALGLVNASFSRELAVGIFGALAMFGLGFWDDVKPLGARVKLLGQVLIATGVWSAGIRISVLSNPLNGDAIQLGIWGLMITVLWLVALTNLINLIDGLDGLAGGLSLLLIGLLAYFRIQNGFTPYLCLALMGALIVFLRYNFPPARIYLGDGGAYFLGSLIGVLAIISSHKGTVMAALIAPLFVLTLPIIDVSLAVLRRGLKGLPIFRPDRRHIHHRLLEMGMSRRKAVLGLYAFTLFFLVLALALFWGEGRTMPILVGFGTLCLLLLAGQFDFSREWFAVGKVLGNSVEMREEVAYALSVTRWLRQESRRVQSMEEFWKLMTFAAERLGFISLTLELPDGRREWKVDNMPLAFHQRRFNLGSSGAGVLELRSRVCNHLDPVTSNRSQPHHCGRAVPCVGDRRVFSIVGELFVEVWHDASKEFHRQAPAVQFDTRFDRRRNGDTTVFRWARRLRSQTR